MKITFKTILSFLVLLCGLTWLAVIYFPDSKLKLVFCDVGQGDAALISKGSNQILIDGGPNDKVLSCLRNNMPLFDRKIEVIALTHPEADHMTGLISVLDKYGFDYFLMGPEGNGSSGFEKLINKLQSFNIEVRSAKWETGNEVGSGKVLKSYISLQYQASHFQLHTSNSNLVRIINPYSGTRIKVGDLVLDTLWPEREWVAEKLGVESVIANFSSRDYTNYQAGDITANGTGSKILGYTTTKLPLNQFSLVFLLKYKDKRVLFMGDADSKVQYNIAYYNTLLPIDILKYPHHGSKTGMTEGFLKLINPKQAVISVGKNSYGHPTPETLDLLNSYKVIIRRTDLEGEVKYVF